MEPQRLRAAQRAPKVIRQVTFDPSSGASSPAL